MHFGDGDDDALKLGRREFIVMMHCDDALQLGRKKCTLVMAMIMYCNWEEKSAF